jgi:hypothetical protein
MSDDIKVIIEPFDDPRLGRQVVHDPRSRSFAMPVTVDRSTWRDKAVRIYDPLPNPNQPIGNCTGCAKAMQFNAIGNRVTGVVLDMEEATAIYSAATGIDPWEGSWPPEDTGSSGLASAQAAIALGYGAEYRWLFGGADEVVQAIMGGAAVSVGTWWYSGMFSGQGSFAGLPTILPSGSKAGGHQYLARGYDEGTDLVLCRCWWGSYRDFWMKRTDLDALLADDGDAHVQRRKIEG